MDERRAAHTWWRAALIVAMAAGGLALSSVGCSCGPKGIQVNGDGGLPDQAVPPDDGGTTGEDAVRADEGPLNPCGSHKPGCEQDHTGGDAGPIPLPTDQPPPDNVTANGVGRDPASGGITLDETTVRNEFMWIANTDDLGRGTVSKIDTQNLKEVARYYTTRCPAAGCTDVNGQPVQTANNSPSRTAVDRNGDAWVANRAFGGQASATKFANDVKDCIDRNGDSFIATSHDANGDGVIDPNNLLEFPGDADECILFTTNYGAVNEVGRSIALDAGDADGSPGNAWVATNTASPNKVYRIDGTTGQITAGPINLDARLFPYGVAMDGHNILWLTDTPCSANTSGYLGFVNTQTLAVGPLQQNPWPNPTAGCAISNSYGIAVDSEQNLWIGGWYANAAFRYRPNRTSFETLHQGTWTRVTLPAARGPGRGIAPDTRGFVWMAHTAEPGVISRIPQSVADGDHDGSGYPAYTLSGGGTIGVGLDFSGHVWGINQTSSNATRIFVDAAGTPTGQLDTVVVGSHPYTYSDFTGYGLRNFVAPHGSYTYLIEGCATPTKARWIRVEWSASTPGGTSVTLRVRTSDDPMFLGNQFGPWDASPALLEQAPGGPIDPNPSRYLELDWDLSSPLQEAAPILYSFGVTWECQLDIP